MYIIIHDIGNNAITKIVRLAHREEMKFCKPLKSA